MKNVECCILELKDSFREKIFFLFINLLSNLTKTAIQYLLFQVILNIFRLFKDRFYALNNRIKFGCGMLVLMVLYLVFFRVRSSGCLSKYFLFSERC